MTGVFNNPALRLAKPGSDCEKCGKQFSGFYCGDCRAKEYDEEQRERRYANALKCLETSLPARYRSASFTSPTLNERVKDRAAIAKAQARLVAPMTTITGPSGAGKTTLACAMLRALVEGKHATIVRFAFAADLCQARAQHRLGGGEVQAVEDAMAYNAVVVIDDLGQEPENQWARVLVEVVDFRHREELPTIVTTFLSPAQVVTRYGDGFARRLFEGGSFIEVKAK